MPHNGRRAQLNLWFPTYWGGRDYPFLNFVKTSGAWSYTGSGAQPAPDTLNADGYPTTLSAAIRRVLWIPNQDSRPGNWVVRWVGDPGSGLVRLSATSHTIVSGSTSGANGRFVFTPTGSDASEGALQLFLEITDINVADPITHLELFHADDEARVDAGEVFAPVFKAACAHFGVERFLDWMPNGSSNTSVWAHMTPESVISYGSENGIWLPPGMYKGETTNSGDAFSVDATGFVLADKATVCVTWNAESSGTTPTLNVNETGDVTIANEYGDELHTNLRPAAGKVSTLVYDEDFDAWLLFGGGVTSSNIVGVQSGVPVSLILRLCKEIGAHPWLHVPYLGLDPLTDYAAELAATCKAFTENPANDAAWMAPRIEPANEVWNSGGGFHSTRYGWNKAKVRAGWGGADFQTHDWYGRVLSLMGKAIHTVYNPTGPKEGWPYQVMCGVQESASANASASNPRLGGKHVSVDGGDPASDYATHVSPAMYWNLTSNTATQELQAAYEMSLEDSEDQQAFANAYVAARADATSISLNAMISNWWTWADGFGLRMAPYEGGYSPDFLTSNMSATVTGASKAAQCVLTFAVSSNFPPVGSSLSLASVGGMTELNGNTYAVVAVDQNNRLVTIDVNSTGFTTYTSGGTATFVNSMTLRNAFRLATKFAPAIGDITKNINSRWLARGEYPSAYVLTGPNGWAKLYPDIYATPTEEWDAWVAFSESVTPLRFTIRLAAA